jgi:hypothetical protein
MITNEQMYILAKVLTLPPGLKGQKITADQQKYWLETKAKFELIYQLLECYFNGQPYQEILINLDKPEQDFYSAKLDYFLSFYDLVQSSWLFLEDAAMLEGRNFYDSPGELFARFLEDKAKAQIHICTLGRYEVSPRKRNEMIRLRRKSEAGDVKKISLDNLDKWIRKIANLGFSEFANLEEFCLAIASQQKEKYIKTKLANYLKARKNVEDVTIRINRTKQAYAWQNGYKLESRKAGGTYKPANS